MCWCVCVLSNCWWANISSFSPFNGDIELSLSCCFHKMLLYFKEDKRNRNKYKIISIHHIQSHLTSTLKINRCADKRRWSHLSGHGSSQWWLCGREGSFSLWWTTGRCTCCKICATKHKGNSRSYSAQQIISMYGARTNTQTQFTWQSKAWGSLKFSWQMEQMSPTSLHKLQVTAEPGCCTANKVSTSLVLI